MAVTVSIVRNRKTETVGTNVEYCTATLSGTYTTGGFTFNPRLIVAGPGSSPVAGAAVIDVDWRSPLGYTYRSTTTVSGMVSTTTTKIYTAPGTELANGTAVPDATCPVIIVKSKA